MPQAYFEHDADVGVIGRGATPEQAFAAAAAASAGGATSSAASR
jgi:SHS2 domain-containing protein